MDWNSQMIEELARVRRAEFNDPFENHKSTEYPFPDYGYPMVRIVGAARNQGETRMASTLKVGDRVLYSVNGTLYNALVLGATEGRHSGTGNFGTHLKIVYVDPQGVPALPTILTGVSELVEGKKTGFVIDLGWRTDSKAVNEMFDAQNRTEKDLAEARHMAEVYRSAYKVAARNLNCAEYSLKQFLLSPEKRDKFPRGFSLGADLDRDGKPIIIDIGGHSPIPVLGTVGEDDWKSAVAHSGPMGGEVVSIEAGAANMQRTDPSASDLDAIADEQKAAIATDTSQASIDGYIESQVAGDDFPEPHMEVPAAT